MSSPNSKTGKRRVVVLLSDKRSGSTIVQDELAKHPDVQHVAYSPHTYSETMHWLKGARLLDMPRETYYGHQYYSTFKSARVARAYLEDLLAGNEIDVDSFNNDRDMVFAGWESLCEKYAQPVFFEKSPQYLSQWCCLSLLLEWIETTEFDVKIIGLVRNPLSVLYSAEELFLTDSQVRQYNWAEKYRNLLAFERFIPPDQFRLIRYEDLIASPQEKLAELQNFIGLETQDEIGEQVHGSSKEKWRNDRNYGLQLDESVKQVARVFGYTNDQLFNEGDKLPNPTLLMRFKRFAKKQKNALLNRVVKPLRLPKGRQDGQQEEPPK